ncbi:hypothetical protein Ocin01_18015 [Orchesella cincta]|uniref:Uncharacterized protein n=1 Tax=Orchesella cincta TaxID=48709 RepID=A0A1D2M6X5_ORCCI|nr:hypothetical protein Ocin01_18015 [Orchesella cincta]
MMESHTHSKSSPTDTSSRSLLELSKETARVLQDFRTTPPRHLDPWSHRDPSAHPSSVIFVLDKKTDFISAPHSLLYFGIVVFFVYFKISSILLGITTPVCPVREHILCVVHGWSC